MDSFVNNLYIRLEKAFREGHVPDDEAGFFRFAATRLLHLLIDEAKKLRRRGPTTSLNHPGDSDNPGGLDPASDSVGPVEKAEQAELYERIARLTDLEPHLKGIRRLIVCRPPPSPVFRWS